MNAPKTVGVGWVRPQAVTHLLLQLGTNHPQCQAANNQLGVDIGSPAAVGYAAARLTHPTARLIAGQLRLPEAEAKLCKELP